MNTDWIAMIMALGPLRWGHWVLLAIALLMFEVFTPVAFGYV